MSLETPSSSVGYDSPVEEINGQVKAKAPRIHPLDCISRRHTRQWRPDADDHSSIGFKVYFTSCVVLDDDVYVVDSENNHVLFKYSQAGSTWSPIRFAMPTVIYQYSLGILGGYVVRIGGKNYYDQRLPCTGEVRRLEPHEAIDGSFQWGDSQMPGNMTTPRCWPAVASNLQYIAVCGGQNDQKQKLDCVEILDIGIQQWMKVQCLPFFGYRMNASMDDTHLYVSNAFENQREVAVADMQNLIASAKEAQNHRNRDLHGCCLQLQNADVIGEALVGDKFWNAVEIECFKNQALMLFEVDSCILAVVGSESLYAYFPATNKFNLIQKLADIDSKKALVDGSSVTFQNGKIVIIGGQFHHTGLESTEVKAFSKTE